jgi:hypothetical protein
LTSARSRSNWRKARRARSQQSASAAKVAKVTTAKSEASVSAIMVPVPSEFLYRVCSLALVPQLFRRVKHFVPSVFDISRRGWISPAFAAKGHASHALRTESAAQSWRNSHGKRFIPVLRAGSPPVASSFPEA